MNGEVHTAFLSKAVPDMLAKAQKHIIRAMNNPNPGSDFEAMRYAIHKKTITPRSFEQL